jgi:uncharacterized protein (DUF305 family)
MIAISFIIIFIIFIVIILNRETKEDTSDEDTSDEDTSDEDTSDEEDETTICNKQLTDNEYINHMIKHHEVAVIMSENHMHNTKNPIIFDILRNLIRLQKYEINLMKDSIYEKMNDVTSNKSNNNTYLYRQGDFTKPNTPGLSNTFCDPGFFEMSHNKELHKMTDAMYIQHMIPHHQVAVDMSKKLLKTTQNDFIIDLAYKIIHNQQSEITKLYYLSKSKYIFESDIL